MRIINIPIAITEHLPLRAIIKAFFLVFFFYINGIGWHSLHAQDTTKTVSPKKEKTIVNNIDNDVESIQEVKKNYYVINRKNKFQSQVNISVNRETPQACLENFILSVRNKEYLKASQSLNLNLLPDAITEDQVKELVNKLYIVINQNIRIDWDKLPDRPDGQMDGSTSQSKVVSRKTNKNISFGNLNLDEIDVELRLQRVKYKDNTPYWVISANTVENIDALYANYGPTQIVQLIPDWGLENKFLDIPIWKIIGFLISLAIAYAFGWLTIFILRRIFGRSSWEWISSISFRLALPASGFIAMLIFYLLIYNFISFDGNFANGLNTTLLIITVAFGTWFVMRFMDAFMSYLAQNKTENIYDEENLESRRTLTHLSVARRVVTFIILLVGLGIILSQFESLKSLGVSLFASAGVATIIIGIAAQSTLGNIIAGIQIAVTKPAQIGDLVIFKDQWGHVEDLGFVFMVVKTWDERRLVIPLKSVISNSFENWSMRGSSQIRSIDIYTDYRVNVQKIRKEFEKLLKNSSDWDGNTPPSVQVIESTDKAIKIRALCSAKDPFTAWDLQCDLREKLITYICELEKGIGLTKTRVAIENRNENN